MRVTSTARTIGEHARHEQLGVGVTIRQRDRRGNHFQLDELRAVGSFSATGSSAVAIDAAKANSTATIRNASSPAVRYLCDS